MLIGVVQAGVEGPEVVVRGRARGVLALQRPARPPSRGDEDVRGRRRVRAQGQLAQHAAAAERERAVHPDDPGLAMGGAVV